MKHFAKFTLICGLAFSLGAAAAEGGLSRELKDEELTITVPGKIDSYDRGAVVSGAFDELMLRLTGGRNDHPVSMDRGALEEYVESVDSTGSGIAVRFSRNGILKLFQDRQMGIYLDTPPDVIVWLSWEDPDGSVRILSDGDSNGFTAALKERSAFFGQSVFFPMMDADDMTAVTVDALENYSMDTVAAASARYGTRYAVAGTRAGGNIHWELYDLSRLQSPLYQSSITGDPHQSGMMMARDLVSQFSQGREEKVRGIRGAAAPASGRVGLTGAAVGKNKAYVVIAGRMSFPELMSLERRLRQVQGLTKLSLYQTQADQNVYEIIHSGTYEALAEGIRRIPGVKQTDYSKPFNFAYDAAYVKTEEPKAETSAVSTDGDLKENRPAAATQGGADGSGASAAGGAQKPATGTEETAREEGKKEGADKPAEKEEQPQAAPKMQAIPITDPDSIIDTSNERL